MYLDVGRGAVVSGHEYQGLAEWRPLDLEELAERFHDGATRVVREGDRYYLASGEIDNRDEDAALNVVAKAVLTRVNGLARVVNPEFRPVKLSGEYGDGEKQHVIVEVDAPFEARGRLNAAVVVIGDQVVAPSEPPTTRRLELAAADPEVNRVLTIMASSEALDWVRMYKVYEIVRAQASDGQMKRWAIKSEITSFTHSANSPAVSGDDKARHAHFPHKPPKKPFSENEGRQFIARLVENWLASIE